MIWNEVSTEEELRSIGTFIEIKALINSDLDGICLLKARSWATLFKKITKLQEIFSQNNDHEKDSMHLPELDFFKSITHKYIYCLTQLDGEERKKQLSVTMIHYVDSELAKQWRKKIAQLIHPDKCSITGANEAFLVLNKMYKEMVHQ